MVVAVPGAIVAKRCSTACSCVMPLPGAPGADSRGEPPAAGAAGEPEPSPATAGAEAPWRGIGSFDYFAVAIATMFAMFTVHSVTVYFAVDRASGAYARIRAAGVSRRAYRVAGFVSAVGVGVLFLQRWRDPAALRGPVGEPPAWLVLALVGRRASQPSLLPSWPWCRRTPRGWRSLGSAVFIVLSFLGGSTVPLNVVLVKFARAFGGCPTGRCSMKSPGSRRAGASRQSAGP